jgi:Pyruvate/2-oxoacid:ferredoxin oxidoreductase delta subunit
VVCVSLSSYQLHWLLLVDFDSGCGVCFSVLLSITLVDFDSGCGVCLSVLPLASYAVEFPISCQEFTVYALVSFHHVH